METKATESWVRGADVRWSNKIPASDGIELNSTIYLPLEAEQARPAIVTLTPYVAQTFHDVGMFFACRGFPFLTVDVRGRGDSQGEFDPLRQESSDGYDVVEWVARQPWCNAQVAMWGGSYAGYNQWMTASRVPPSLAAIAPAASPFAGLDFPLADNIAQPHMMQWLTFVTGRASQDKIYWNQQEWSARFRDFLRSGRPFNELDAFIGNRSATFQEWIQHPCRDKFWENLNPRPDEYAKLALPILTITGQYDSDQPGALMHYREHMRHGSPACIAQHHLIIGPWDHPGTRTPLSEFCGLTCGPASVLDLRQLHLEWYEWVLEGKRKPNFLAGPVAYYMMGAEEWRYAETLSGVTESVQELYLDSTVNPVDIFHSGILTPQPPRNSTPDTYVYDPLDTSLADLECEIDYFDVTDQRLMLARTGKQLVYHSEAFKQPSELAGHFKLQLWLGIDQPDTDFVATIYAVDANGQSTRLAQSFLRARHREGPSEANPITTSAPLRYTFEDFYFIARRIHVGCRIRLTVGPVDSIYRQRNYNDGSVVAFSTAETSRPVRVELFHDEEHRSMLSLPIAAASS